MRVVINKKHLILNEKLIKDLNKCSKNFSNKNYSRIENIDNALINQDISVEKKKKRLIENLHYSIVDTFSIDKNKFNKASFHSLKDKLHSIRKVIDKLRSINYYLETTFLEELKLSRIKIKKDSKLKQENIVARDELEILEYSAYKLIGHAVMLDKTALKEYKGKERITAKEEKIEVENLDIILRKESAMLEHLEAKLPPPKAISAVFIREPIFTHWAARVLALMLYLEHLHSKETKLFDKLKKSNAARRKINKKIMYIIKEKSKLVRIMEEKSISMKKLRVDNDFKKELHNFTTAINL